MQSRSGPGESRAASSAANDDAPPAEILDQLQRLHVPDIDEDAGHDPSAPMDLSEIPEPAPELISVEAFHEVFCLAFNAPGMFLPPLKPLGIQPGEEDPARACSQAVHRLLEIYYPAALKPGSETFALLAQAMPFLVAKVMAARAIVAALKAPKERKAAGDQEPPKAKDEPTQEPRAASPVSWMDGEGVAA